jgi:hypothetical protein
VHIRKEVAMTKVICTASVDEKNQRDTLCECLKMFGLEVAMNKKTVCIEYTGDKTTAAALVDIFESYPQHGICVLE